MSYVIKQKKKGNGQGTWYLSSCNTRTSDIGLAARFTTIEDANKVKGRLGKTAEVVNAGMEVLGYPQIQVSERVEVI